MPNSGALAEDGSRLVAFGTSSRTYDNILVNIPYYPATSIPTIIVGLCLWLCEFGALFKLN